MPKVADLMTRDAVMLRPDTSLGEALACLETRRIAGAGVMTRRHQLLGMIARVDIIEAEAEVTEPEARRRLLEETTVSDLMSAPPLSIGPEAEPVEAALAMDFGDVHRLFVVQNGEVLGVLSRTDLRRAALGGAAAS